MPVYATIIKPAPGAAGFAHWTRRIAFGDRLPSGRTSGFAHLEVDDPNEATVFAAFSGKLSTRQPTGFLQPGVEAIEEANPDDSTLTLYLEPTTAKLNPEWQALSAEIATLFAGVADAATNAASVGYVTYRNVDIGRAKAVLCTLLKKKGQAAAAPVCDEALWKRFVGGEGSISVRAGDEIGAAGPSYLPATPANRRQFSFALRTRFGMFDLGEWYEKMTSLVAVQAPPAAAQLAQLLGTHIPLIDPAQSVNIVGTSRLWPWSALLQYKRDKGLIYSDWRKLGNLQKTEYLKQLKERARPANPPTGAPIFEFDVDDMSNVFQLEAVAEFYQNFPDPWNAATQPLAAGSAGYRTLNFLALYGNAAQVNGNVVTLDDSLDMNLITTGRDTVRLEADTARAGKCYRIMAVDRANQTVTLEAPPLVVGATAWRIYHNPTLVQIDAFGSRIRGAKATTGALPQSVQLENLSDTLLTEIAKTNPYDTIALASVTAGSPRYARVKEVPQIDRAARTATLKLDRALSPVAAGSPWSIPAGVGGVQGDIRKAKNPASTVWGWDNYDGMMFLLGGGEVKCAFPWSTYTSRKQSGKGGTQFHSSLKGNKHYRFGSVFSRKKYINLSFSVIDAEGLIWGDVETPSTVAGQGRVMIAPDITLSNTLVRKFQNIYFIDSKPPRFTVGSIAEVDTGANKLRVGKQFAGAVPANPAPYWIALYDAIREARFYFKPGFEEDTAPAGELPPYGKESLGKGGIRIHMGGIGIINSEGCQVSPYIMRLRMAMIAYHVEANVSYYQENRDNPKLDQVPGTYSDMHVPPVVVNYLQMIEELGKLQQQLSAEVANPLGRALDEVLRAEPNNDAQLQALRQAIINSEARLASAQDIADTPSENEIIPAIQMLTDLAADQDVITAVEWAREHAERVSRLTQNVRELSARIDNEVERWGWNNAMHGDYWVIRPDERAE